MRKKTKPDIQIERVSIDSVYPSNYNPRESEKEKLELIKLSLMKFGYLIPIYAAPSGEILSGHQRHLVSKQIGLKQIPVVYIRNLEIETRKNINVVFNRATNDFKQKDTNQSVDHQLKSSKIINDLHTLKDLSKEEIIEKCLNFEYCQVQECIQDNSPYTINNYAKKMASILFQYKIFMPVILNGSGKIINGSGRLEMAANYNFYLYPCVSIKDEHAEYLKVLLNYLTMNFSIHKEYADILRYNAFRRKFFRETPQGLSQGFIFGINPLMHCCDFRIYRKEDRDKFERAYGSSILDFGAGSLRYSRNIHKMGFKSVPFEPYHANQSGVVDKERSLEIVDGFFGSIEQRSKI